MEKKNLREVLRLERYTVSLDPAAAAFYRKVAQNAGLPVEQVLADSLYRLAGSLSLEAVVKQRKKEKQNGLPNGLAGDIL